MKPFFIRCSVVLVFVSQTVFSLSAEGWTWSELRTKVKDSNPEVLAEAAMAQRAQQTVLAEASDIMPLRLGYSLMDLQPTSLGFLGQASHRLTLSQELPVTGRLEAQAAQARAEAEAQSFSLAGMIRERTLLVDKAIVLYQLQTRLQENLDTQLGLVQQLILAAKIQYSTGKLSYSALVSLQIKLADLEVEQKAREQNRQESLLQVQELTGIDDSNFSIKVPGLNPPPSGWSVVDLGSLLSSTLAGNPQKLSLAKKRESVLATADVERARAYPDLGLMAETTYRGMDGALLFAFGVDFGLPVLGSKGVEAKISEAESEVLAQERKLDAVNLSLKKQVERLVRARASNLDQIALLEEKAIGPGQENIAHMFREYQVQGTDLQAVVDAVFTSFELKNRYYELLAEVYGIDFELEALSGSENLVSRNVL